MVWFSLALLFHVAVLSLPREVEFPLRRGPGFFDDAMEKNDFLIHHDKKDSGNEVSQ
jgi:hypothetical protein